MDDADGVEREANDRLSTSPVLLAAELSTMLLRWRPEGRCAASWITSETVSGARGFIPRLTVTFAATGKWDSLPEIAPVQSSDCRKILFEDAALCIGH
jgi:hypothetical protein